MLDRKEHCGKAGKNYLVFFSDLPLSSCTYSSFRGPPRDLGAGKGPENRQFLLNVTLCFLSALVVPGCLCLPRKA